MPSNSGELTESPFQSTLDSRYFYSGTSHEEALSRLHFLVDNGRRLGLVRGSGGCGKSMLLEVFAKQAASARRHVFACNVMGVDQTEFLWALATGLGSNPLADAPQHVLWREVTDAIVANRYQRVQTLILIDDADEAEPDVLTAIARLAQVDMAESSHLTLVLAAEVGRSQRLGRRLCELAELRVDIEPWDMNETAQFIRSSLSRAGGEVEMFDDAAMRRIHDLSGGIPRRAKQLCELAWIARFGQDMDQIDESTIDSVDRELAVGLSASKVG